MGKLLFIGKFQLVNVEEMTEIKNHFRTTIVITDSGKNYQ